MKSQHIFVRIFVTTIFSTMFSCIVLYITYVVHNKLECYNLVKTLDSKMCGWLRDVVQVVTKRHTEITQLIGAEVIILIGWVYTYLVSWI